MNASFVDNFHLDGFDNRHNYPICGLENPQEIVEKEWIPNVTLFEMHFGLEESLNHFSLKTRLVML